MLPYCVDKNIWAPLWLQQTHCICKLILSTRFLRCFSKTSLIRIAAFQIVALWKCLQSIFTVIKWQMFNIKGSPNLNLFQGGFCLKKKIILGAFQLRCTLHIHRMYEREKTVDGKMFQVHGMCLNLVLLNQRADSGSFSFYYPLETYSQYYVIKLGKGRECTDSWTKATQTAVPVQTAVRLFVSEKLGRPR